MGRIYFGGTGAILILLGLWRLPHPAHGIYVFGGTGLCFALEGVFQTYRVAALAGTLLLAYTSWKFLAVPLALASIGSLFLGLITTTLLSVAKQASQNKHADL